MTQHFSMNVLVIEDDKRIAGLVERGLKENGHRVSISHNGAEGAQLMLEESYDVALFDILLPGMDGLAVLENVRLRRCKTPIQRALQGRNARSTYWCPHCQPNPA